MGYAIAQPEVSSARRKAGRVFGGVLALTALGWHLPLLLIVLGIGLHNLSYPSSGFLIAYATVLLPLLVTILVCAYRAVAGNLSGVFWGLVFAILVGVPVCWLGAVFAISIAPWFYSALILHLLLLLLGVPICFFWSTDSREPERTPERSSPD